jgi:20S proteasome alpha/beta subunit
VVGAGVPADCATFNDYLQKNLKLYELNNDIKLSTRGAANYIRGEVRAVGSRQYTLGGRRQ